MNELQQLSTGLADRYTIEHLIGEGGMASVYRAQDLRHGRAVAIKVLKPELGAILGAERFEAEIRVTAALQHPNLLPLFDSGAVGGLLYYVMPFVEGETLRARLAREKQLPVDETVRLLSAIASALAYAHGLGVIHRDLKPENILLQAGQPVVADFGIALAVSKAGGQRITQTGLSLGTPQYMSPEQATGDRDVDGRSDLYALGAIAYELLTGEPPHTGATSQAVIARLLTEAPRPVRAVRASVPVWLESRVMRLLEKLPADRFATAGELVEALRRGRDGTADVPRRDVDPPPRRRLAAWSGALLAMALAGAAYGVGRTRPDSERSALPVQRYAIEFPDAFTPIVDNAPVGAISPDGRYQLVLGLNISVGQPAYLRRSDRVELEPVANSDQINFPVFAPDNGSILYQDGATNTLRRYSIAERRSESIAPLSVALGGMDVTDDNRVVASAVDSTQSGLSMLSLTGGEWTPLTRASQTGEKHVWPVVLPGSKQVAFSIARTPQSRSELALANLETGSVTTLAISGVRPLGVIDQQLIYLRADGMLMAVAWSAARTPQAADATQLGLSLSSIGPEGSSSVSLGRSGALLTFTPRLEIRSAELVDDRTVRATGPFIEQRLGVFQSSADGKTVMYLSPNDALHPRLVFADRATGRSTGRSQSQDVTSAIWEPGTGRVIMTTAAADGSYRLLRETPAAAVPAETLSTIAARDLILWTVMPDGRLLASRLNTQRNESELIALEPTSPHAWSVRSFDRYGAVPAFSPDGRWVAYQTTREGYPMVVVQSSSFDGPVVPVMRDTTIGVFPAWTQDSKGLYVAASSGALHKIALAYDDAGLPRIVADNIVNNLIADAVPLPGLANLLRGERMIQNRTEPDGRLTGALLRNTRGRYLYVPNWADEVRAKIGRTKPPA